MAESILYTSNILLTQTSVVNFFSAIAVILIGIVVYTNNRKSVSHRLFLIVALFLGFWAFSSTMSDVMHAPKPAMFWARLAIVGPFYFPAYFLIFTHFFPKPNGTMSNRKAMLIMLPAIIVSLLVFTPFNVERIELKDWGTDFTPGILYTLGLPYIFIYLGWAASNLWRSRRRTRDLMVKKQAMFVFLGIALVIFSLVLTNAILPLVFKYGKASVFGPAASLVFALFTSYAVLKHGLLKVKIIATEIFVIALLLLNFIPLFSQTTIGQFYYQFAILGLSMIFAVLLIKSVRKEEANHQELDSLAAKLTEANTQLEALNEAKSEFISIASHQLRTPASVLKGYLALMLEGAYGEVNATFKEKLEQMYSMNERLIHLINNILNMSRIEKGRLEFLCSYVNVPSIIDEAVSELMIKAKEKGLRLHFAKPEVELAKAYVDGDKLHEIVVNLVENAIKYSIKGSIDVAVKTEAGRQGDEVVILVKDTGIGMTEVDTKRMFEKFYRASNTLGVPRETGTGLGLYICAKFLDNMGGRIWVESSVSGKGTIFAVALPTKPQQRCTKG